MFVGSDRIEIVDSLVEAFRSVAEGGGPRAVVLSAPTGWGKTAIVQEFYARIAAQQSEPSYWPPRLEGVGDLSWTQTRKRVAPLAFEVPAGADLPWMWWGISCARRQDGRFAQAMFDDASQLALHGGSLFDRMGRGDLTGRSFDGASALVSVLGLLGVALAPPAAAGLAVAGAARTLWQSRDLLDRLTQWRTRRERKSQGYSIDVEEHPKVDQLQQLAHDLEAVSRKVPIVLVVDDAQWADSTLLETLSWVMGRSTARVLVVATTWPLSAEQGDRNPFHQWIQEISSSEPLARSLELIRLESFGENTLRDLLHAEVRSISSAEPAELDESIIDGVIELVGGTPMGVRALFGLERTRALVADGDFTLDAIRTLPADLDDALRSYWKEIPADVQAVLAIAAVMGNQFLSTAVVEAATAQGIENGHERLRRGEYPYTYVRSLQPELTAFVDPHFHATASRFADELFTPKQMHVIREAVVDFALGATLEQYPAVICELAWSLHVSLGRENLVSRHLAAESSLRLSGLMNDRWDLSGAMLLLQEANSWLGDDVSDLSFLVRNNLAYLHGEIGDFQQAFAMFEALITDEVRVLGRLHSTSLRSRFNFAHLVFDLGNLHRAQELFGELVVDLGDVFGVHDEWTLDAQIAAACVRGEQGQVDDAIEELRSISSLAGQVLGAEHSVTLASLNNLSTYLVSARRFREANSLLEDLLERRHRILGSTSPDTLYTTLQIGACLYEAGQTADALQIFEDVLSAQSDLLGSLHPDSMMTRGRILECMIDLERLSDAGEFGQSLLNDRYEILGHEHRLTIATRLTVASTVAGLGDYQTAVKELRDLEVDAIRFLGERHRTTINTRQKLADCLGQLGHAVESVRILTEVLQSRIEVFGPEDPETFNTRNLLAWWLAESGEVDRGVEELETLLRDQRRVLDADDVSVMFTQCNIARWVGEQGDVRRAIEILEQVCKNRLRALGPNHPDLLATRSNLAGWKLVAGDVEGGVTDLELLLEDQVRILGADHPDTQTSIRNLTLFDEMLGLDSTE